MTESKTPDTNNKSISWKKVWHKFVSVGCGVATVIMWFITGIMKVFNFCLEIILILCGQIKVVTKVDDDK